MELNALINTLLAIISPCSVNDATLVVIKFQALYLLVKEKRWRNVHFGHLGEMSVGEMSGYHMRSAARSRSLQPGYFRNSILG